MSDLHLEFGKMHRGWEPPESDVSILAGDIAPGKAGMAWAMLAYKNYPGDVLYVPGNHELYNRSMSLYQELEAKAQGSKNITFMELKAVTIQDVRFIGATLWTDFRLHGETQEAVFDAAMAARSMMNDFYVIEGMSVQMWFDRNRFGREFILRELEKAHDDGLKAVVATHHGPHANSISPKFVNSKWKDLNPAYASNFLETIPREIAPKLWFHGHTHDKRDYYYNDTRVLVNPRGYVGGGDLNNVFDPFAVVEI